jgi:hypothetical protein
MLFFLYIGDKQLLQCRDKLFLLKQKFGNCPVRPSLQHFGQILSSYDNYYLASIWF